MERIDKIMAHPVFVDSMKVIEEAEINRIYCLHGMDHSIDVARISYIIDLEDGLGIPKDIIYAAALLHDIGRCIEYKEGKSHHIVGTELAKEILSDCDYREDEIEMISNAILHHKRKSDDEAFDALCDTLYQADKLSRKCYDCKAYDSCYWSEDMKNKTVFI